MSRGLGKLQHEILQAIDTDWQDLWEVSKSLRAGAKEDTWQAAFSRAVRSLERRRAIEIRFLGRQRRWARIPVNETLPDMLEHQPR
jgi:hypothetical protein